MTSPPHGAADASSEPGKESDTVGVDTDIATGPHAAAAAEEAADSDGIEQSADTPADGSAGNRAEDDAAVKPKRRFNFARVFAYGVLPGLVLLLAAAAGYLRWQNTSDRDARIAGVESVAAARDGTIAMLSYQPDTVEKDLGAARDRLTGTFKESYTQLTNDVVIPGSKQRHISAVATVPAAASVSATGSHAVALVFVNQTVVVGDDAPSATASSVRVTLDRIGDRWLISGFDPV